MRRTRHYGARLAKLLSAASRPIYVLDESLTIVYANPACLAWLGVTAEDLIGKRCTYQTPWELSGVEAAAAVLCPPPDVLTGTPVTTHVCLPRAAGNVYRQVHFLPLGEAAGAIVAVVAVLGTEDLAAPPTVSAAPPNDEDAALHDLLRQFRREAAARHRVDRVAGRSPAMRRAQRQIEAAIASHANVLVVGPNGSDQQHIATAIHYGLDADTAGALVPLDCAVLDLGIIRSTVAALAAGAAAGRPAGRSTLLFQRIDLLPSESQEELAEYLSARHFPLRVIATSEVPLAPLVENQRLSADLAAVVGVVTVELPPLVSRREDVPLFAQHFLEQANASGPKQVARFTPEALDALVAYHWPGDVAELAKFIAAAHEHATGVEIQPADLPERIHLAAQAAAYPRRPEKTIVLDEFLRQIEQELIERAVRRSKGNKAKAARLLGMNRARLGRRMVQLGLEKEEQAAADEPTEEPSP